MRKLLFSLMLLFSLVSNVYAGSGCAQVIVDGQCIQYETFTIFGVHLMPSVFWDDWDAYVDECYNGDFNHFMSDAITSCSPTCLQ